MAAAVAAIASPAQTWDSAAVTWPPFVLVAGLLLIGVVAHRDGLFEVLGGVAARFRGRPAELLLGLLAIVALVTVVLNLDTSVAFLTPVLVVAARNRGVDEEPFLYGTLLMSNAASLLLPGSNLTNLLILANERVAATVFAERMLPAWVVSVAVTAGFVVVTYRRRLQRLVPEDGERGEARRGAPTARSGAGLSPFVVAGAVVLVLILHDPAPAVFVAGVAATAHAVRRRSLRVGEAWAAVDPASLAGVFGVAVALGTAARLWSGPAHLMAHAGIAETAALGALAAVVVNNLPAAVLLGSRHPLHPASLLLGLDLGPNLAVTGSLSALIWFRSASAIGARPSVARVSRLGLLLVPVTIAAALLAGALVASGPAGFGR